MSYYVVDCESDGPIPHKYSLISFGAVKVTPKLDTTFYGETKPVSDLWIPEALAVSGTSRDKHKTFDDPKEVFQYFHDWIEDTTVGRPVFISDNLAYDWQWINFYFHYYIGKNPFGFSGRRIGDLYAGIKMDTFVKWKHLRDTKHNHHPVSDALGNAEVLLKLKDMGLKIKLI